MDTLPLPTACPDYTLLHARAVLPGGIVGDAGIVVSGGKIVGCGAVEEIKPAGEIFDLAGYMLFPGLIDTHVHAAVGRDFMEGSQEAVDAICRAHAAGGTTRLLATTVTETIPRVSEALRALEESRRHQDPRGARILGAHVEGPFLSPERPGVHDITKMMPPTSDALATLAGAGLPVRILTFAPELPGSAVFLAELGARGILGSGGHSDAWDEEAQAAFDAGLRRVTHTFNCMSSARKRGAVRVAGLLEFALAEPEITCELIPDGIHVSPTLTRMLYRAKGASGICLITDASAGCGMPEGEPFFIAGRKCVVSQGRSVTVDGAALAGSALTMLDAVRNMVAMARIPLEEAVRMASANPARELGFGDEIGALQVGARADFLVLRANLELLATYIDGDRAFLRS